MAVLIEEFRGDILENNHHGRISVVDDKGNQIRSFGDTTQMTYYRSSSKPIQTLSLLMYGLDKKYALTEEEIVITSSSHVGETMHLKVLESLLEKTGFLESDLVMLPAYPVDEKSKTAMIRQNLPPRKLLHNCSGKHIGSMMLAQHLDGNHKNYWREDSPAQKEILRQVSAISDIDINQIKLGVDGCGFPVFAVPQRNIAIAYMHLACPDTIKNPDLKKAAQTLAPMINRNNLMIRGTSYLCSILNEDDNIIGKGGAQGVYGFGLKKERLGVSIKIEDGTEDTWPLIISEILTQLEYTNKETIAKLKSLEPYDILNDNNQIIGKKIPIFTI